MVDLRPRESDGDSDRTRGGWSRAKDGRRRVVLAREGTRIPEAN